MSDIVRPAMRFARRQPSAGVERNLHLESARRRSNEGNNRIIPRRTIVNQSGNGDTARPWRRPEYNNILLVHGLQHSFVNCDHIFNLFCPYGNVMTVKILKNKKVLVELDCVEAAKRCMANLHLLPLDDSHQLNLEYSKHSFIYNHVKINSLPDGTPAFKVYSTSRLNRFSPTRTRLETHRPAAPSKILHFYNAPTDVCATKIHKVVTEAIGSTEAIRSIVILPKKQGAKCSTGLIEMKTIDLAVKVILLLNHVKFESTRSRFPFLMKLCFSKWSELKPKNNSLAVLLCTTPRRPRLFLHGSECGGGVFEMEFPVSRMTRLACGDHKWTTLWCLGDDKAEPTAVDPTADDRAQPAGQQHAAGCVIVSDHLCGAGDDDRR